MSYIEQSLISGEQVILKAKLHWGLFIAPIIFLVFSCLISLVLSNDNSGSFICLMPIIFLFIFAGLLQVAVIFFTTEFAVTNKRIIAKTGLIRHRSLELQLSKVESISIKQPIMGRVLNYGTLVVTGSGGTKESFSGIANPMEFRKQINSQIAANS